MRTERVDPAKPGRRLPSLTSLRWFAASVVFLNHVPPLVAGSALDQPASYFTGQGTTGVSFFFMLSGFVLAWTSAPGDRLRAFYRRRFARIAPAYWVATVIAVLVGVVLEHRTSSREVVADLVPFTLLQSWFPGFDIHFGGTVVGWSLSTEVFFYACFPFVIGPLMTMSQRRRTGVLLATGALLVSLAVLLHPAREDSLEYWALYVLPPTRFLEFVIGICLAGSLRAGVRLPVAPSGALAFAAAAYVADHKAPLAFQVYSVTLVPYALLIFACAQWDLDGRRSWLHRPALIRLGQWSYAFYLLHYTAVRVVYPHASDQPTMAWHGAVVVGSYLLATAGAYALFRFVELPLERRLRHGGTATPPEEPAQAWTSVPSAVTVKDAVG